MTGGRSVRRVSLSQSCCSSIDDEILGLFPGFVEVEIVSNSWIRIIMWLYIALKRTPSIDCYWVGAVPKVES